eukprot:4385056-Pleurochrysis_carterae.AAC.2
MAARLSVSRRARGERAREGEWLFPSRAADAVARRVERTRRAAKRRLAPAFPRKRDRRNSVGRRGLRQEGTHAGNGKRGGAKWALSIACLLHASPCLPPSSFASPRSLAQYGRCASRHLLRDVAAQAGNVTAVFRGPKEVFPCTARFCRGYSQFAALKTICWSWDRGFRINARDHMKTGSTEAEQYAPKVHVRVACSQKNLPKSSIDEQRLIHGKSLETPDVG